MLSVGASMQPRLPLLLFESTAFLPTAFLQHHSSISRIALRQEHPHKVQDPLPAPLRDVHITAPAMDKLFNAGKEFLEERNQSQGQGKYTYVLDYRLTSRLG